MSDSNSSPPDSKTRCLSPHTRGEGDGASRIYRVRTVSSTYFLVIREGPGNRTCVFLRGTTSSGQEVFAEDSAPLADGQPLLALNPERWVGCCLAVGSVSTSEVRAVERETVMSGHAVHRLLARLPPEEGRAAEASVAAPSASPGPASAATGREQWQPFPEGYVQRLEAAAYLMQLVYHRRELEAALRADSLLRERFDLALASCHLMLRALHGRGPRGKDA